MVLIPKRKGAYRGIDIVDLAWTVCIVGVNCRLQCGVVLRDSLHGFREGRGTGTDTLEAKLAQQLSGIAHKPLLQVFIDIQKVYNSLDRGRYLEVLRGYGMGLNLDRLLKSYWERQRIVPNMGKFLGKEFWIGGGVTQGDPASPTIFNIVVDAVVRVVLDVVYGPQEDQHSLGWADGERNLIFAPKMEG